MIEPPAPGRWRGYISGRSERSPGTTLGAGLAALHRLRVYRRECGDGRDESNATELIRQAPRRSAQGYPALLVWLGGASSRFFTTQIANPITTFAGRLTPLSASGFVGLPIWPGLASPHSI